MFDNPQKEVNTMSKKLRPPKLTDEEFELFYKEIYAEFGPKPVAPVEPDPVEDVLEQVQEEPVAESVEDVLEEDTRAVLEAEIEEEAAQAVQEEAAKAAALIRNVQEDEVIDGDTDGITLVKPKKKGVKGLVIAICLELLAIAGVVAYWLLYIL